MFDRRIIGYYAVSDFEPEVVAERVEQLLKEGWQPFGQLTVGYHAEDEGQVCYTQVVVMYETIHIEYLN